jgi:hypothetical protein
LTTPNQAAHHFSQEQIVQIITHPKTTKGHEYGYLLFLRTKPTSKYFLSALNKGLAKFCSSGRYDVIQNDLLNGEYAKLQK